MPANISNHKKSSVAIHAVMHSYVLAMMLHVMLERKFLATLRSEVTHSHELLGVFYARALTSGRPGKLTMRKRTIHPSKHFAVPGRKAFQHPIKVQLLTGHR
jgi:hypothetical protein